MASLNEKCFRCLVVSYHLKVSQLMFSFRRVSTSLQIIFPCLLWCSKKVLCPLDKHRHQRSFTEQFFLKELISFAQTVFKLGFYLVGVNKHVIINGWQFVTTKSPTSGCF